MPAEIDTIDIKIMDRIFSIKCPNDKVAELQKSAEYLDKKMREVQSGSKFISLDKVAVIAALNIANETLIKHHYKACLDSITDRISNLKSKIAVALNENI